MNLAFWKKKTSARPVQKLSELEQAILDDVKAHPASWRHRALDTGGLVYRSDRGPVAILADHRSGLARCNYNTIEFGQAFSTQWFATAKQAAEAVAAAEKARAVEHDTSILTKMFLQ